MKLLNFERKHATEPTERHGLTAGAPSHIYLQVCGDCQKSCGDCVHNWGDVHQDAVTWCDEPMSDSDVEYIRLDMAVMSVLQMLAASDDEIELDIV